MDPRIARTRGSLQEALLELARERPLEEITVGDIAERAGVHRSSFYQHYADKDTLLADALDEAATSAIEKLGLENPKPTAPPEALRAYVAYVDANADLYRRALGEHGSAVVIARVTASIESAVRDAIARTGADDFGDLPLDVVAAGITGSAIGILRAWVTRDDRPSVDVAVGWVWRLLPGPGPEQHLTASTPRESTRHADHNM